MKPKLSKQIFSRQLLRRLLLGTALVLVLMGAYVLFLTFSPQAAFIDSPYKSIEFTDLSAAVQPQEDFIYIEKLSLMVPFRSGDNNVLEQGAWHRFPERGNPEKGGNFILSAHRFQMGWTPAHTKRKSPFYDIDKLQLGDHIHVSFNGQKYAYKVSKKYSVKPEASEIEAPSQYAKLTLYTCTLKGSADGRTVIEAESL